MVFASTCKNLSVSQGPSIDLYAFCSLKSHLFSISFFSPSRKRLLYLYSANINNIHLVVPQAVVHVNGYNFF